MPEPHLNITTLLSEFTPEQISRLRSIPGGDASLPANVRMTPELQNHKAFIHRSVTSTKDWIPLHAHSFHECIYCRQVPDMEYLVGAHRYRIHSGDIIYVPQGIPHRPIFHTNCAEPFVRDELWIRSDFIDSFGQRLPADIINNRKTPYLLRLDPCYQAEISSLLQKGVEENRTKLFRWDNVIEAYAWLFLVASSRILSDERTQCLQRENPNLFDRIIAYVEANLSGRITLEDVENQFYVSKSTINRTFQKHTGTSFYRCVTQRRLMAAQQFIMDGTSLDAVSRRVGFSDYATFYRAFKQEFGISPRQFRKMQNQS